MILSGCFKLFDIIPSIFPASHVFYTYLFWEANNDIYIHEMFFTWQVNDILGIVLFYSFIRFITFNNYTEITINEKITKN